jgi:hypothetical protein
VEVVGVQQWIMKMSQDFILEGCCDRHASSYSASFEKALETN